MPTAGVVTSRENPRDYLVVLALDTEAVLIVTEDSHLHDHQDTIPVAVQNPRNFVDSLLEY